MAKRTPEEIAIQVAALKIERTALPERNAFGDDNWKLIDAKLDILEGRFDGDLTAEESIDDYGEDGIADLELTEQWMDGDGVDPPCGDEDCIAKATQQQAKPQ